MIKLIIFLFLTPPNTTNINLWCKHYELHHIDIVTKQCILESGHFTSYNFKVRNNLLGLRHKSNLSKSNTKGYYSFNHWNESILAYKDKVQYKYHSGNYHTFLLKINYASSNNYIQTLKLIKL